LSMLLVAAAMATVSTASGGMLSTCSSIAAVLELVLPPSCAPATWGRMQCGGSA
jgi:hypothetical protein